MLFASLHCSVSKKKKRGNVDCDKMFSFYYLQDYCKKQGFKCTVVCAACSINIFYIQSVLQAVH